MITLYVKAVTEAWKTEQRVIVQSAKVVKRFLDRGAEE